jgi:hypothetical protein
LIELSATGGKMEVSNVKEIAILFAAGMLAGALLCLIAKYAKVAV